MGDLTIWNSSINIPDRRFWGTTKGLTAADAGVYYFAIYNLEDMAIATAKRYKLDPADRTDLAIFNFPVPPSQYEVVEPAATAIIPMQDGGVFVESHGSIFKDIRIGGTVGLRPNVPSSEVLPGLQNSTGISIQYPNTLQNLAYDNRGLHKKEATGFDDIIFLRNLFRFYLDTKKDPEFARKTALLWVYAKESEAYIVEPISFTTSRDAGNPLGWTYSIQVRALRQLQRTWTAVPDSLNIFQKFNKGMEALNRAALDLSRALNTVADVINFVTRLPFSVLDNILRAGINILGGIASIKNSLKVNKLREGYVKNWNFNIREISELLAAREAGSTNSGSGQFGNIGMARKSIRDMWRQSNLLLSLDFLWEEDKNIAVSDYAAAYKDPSGNPPINTGSPLNVSNISIPKSGKQEKILTGETIRSLAKRLTGDEANWKKLVILNNLKSPYVAAERSDGVLSYDDYIIVPKTASEKDKDTQVTRQLDEDASFQQLPKLRRRYGRDLRLMGSTTDSGLADVIVNQRGDLMIIEDEDNVYQAVTIKMATEQGELPTHPTFGTKYPIGEKFPSLSKLQEYSLNTQRTFLQDPRISNIASLNTFVEGDVVRLDAKLQLISSDETLPITFSVRR